MWVALKKYANLNQTKFHVEFEAEVQKELCGWNQKTVELKREIKVLKSNSVENINASKNVRENLSDKIPNFNGISEDSFIP